MTAGRGEAEQLQQVHVLLLMHAPAAAHVLVGFLECEGDGIVNGDELKARVIPPPPHKKQVTIISTFSLTCYLLWFLWPLFHLHQLTIWCGLTPCFFVLF